MSELPAGTVILEDVHKAFRIYQGHSAKETFIRAWKRQPLSTRRDVLKGVSFRVDPGERVGVVGRNGAGKSTLFRLISGIMRPDRGRVIRSGRVSPLIELTAGLVPDLSGAENLRLNAAVLGLTRREIARRFDAIVRFAELESFVHTPVRYYSSGMQARLGFSVATHVDGSVVLIDEALSVGDVAFQRECIRRMRAIADGGATVVFVSHDVELVRSFCTRVIWLEGGVVRADGEPDEVLAGFRTQLAPAPADVLLRAPA